MRDPNEAQAVTSALKVCVIWLPTHIGVPVLAQDGGQGPSGPAGALHRARGGAGDAQPLRHVWGRLHSAHVPHAHPLLQGAVQQPYISLLQNDPYPLG